MITYGYHTEKVMAPYSSTLAWRIPGMGEPGGQPSMGSHRVGHNWSDLAVAAGIKLRKKSTDTLLKSSPPIIRVNRREVPIYNRNNKIPNINLARNVLRKHTYVFCVNSKNIWNWYYFKLKKKESVLHNSMEDLKTTHWSCKKESFKKIRQTDSKVYISRMLLLLLSRFSRVWLCATP